MTTLNVYNNIPIVPNPSGGIVTKYYGKENISITHNIPIPTVSTPDYEIGGGGQIQSYYNYIPSVPIELNIASGHAIQVNKSHNYNIPNVTIGGSFIVTYHGQTVINSPLHYIPHVNNPEFSYTLRTTIKITAAHVFDYPSEYTDMTEQCASYTSGDIELLPQGKMSINDGFLFGLDHPSWEGLIIDIHTPGVGNWTFQWLYWNGEAWVGVGNLQDETSNFRASKGRHHIWFDQPTLWAPTIINGKEAYYIFARIITGTTFTTAPVGTLVRAFRIEGRQKNSRQMMNEDPGVERMTHLHIMEDNFIARYPIKWNFRLADYRDYASQRSLLKPKVYVTRDGKPFIQVNETIEEIGNGWYSIIIPGKYTNCSTLGLRAIAAGAGQCDMVIDLYGKRKGRFTHDDLKSFKHDDIKTYTFDYIMGYE